jgi:hypothetical protein
MITIPTLNDLYTRRLNDYASQLGVSVNDLSEQVRVDSKVDAAIDYEIYLLLSQVQNNIYANKSELSELRRDGIMQLGRDIAPAVQGQYVVKVEALEATIIPEGTQFVIDKEIASQNYIYILDGEETLTAGENFITLRALTAGTEASLEVGTILTSISPLTDANDDVEVIEVVVAPVSDETEEDYRNAVINSKRITAQGGSPSDWRLWASEDSRVRNIYPYMQIGFPNNIDIYVEATENNTKPGESIGYPTQELLDNLYDRDTDTGILIYDDIAERGRRPMSVRNINILPINHINIDINFTNLSNVSLASQLKTSIEDFIYMIRPYVAGGQSRASKKDILSLGELIGAIQGVLSANGATYQNIDMVVDSDTVFSYTFTYGDIPLLNLMRNNGTVI